ncbi:MAG: creatininase family protein [Halobacteriales archaeon]
MYSTDRVTRESWAHRTYAEILETGSEPGSVAVVPVGSTEQHGHHLPVGTDTLLVESVATAAVGRAREEGVPVLVAPPVWTGVSRHHLPFGGTLSLSGTRLIEVLTDIGRTALESEFDAVLFLNGHGGNVPFVESTVVVLGDDMPDAEILGVTYFDLAASAAEAVRDSDPGGMGHGGEFETSLMLHLFPELVDEDQLDGTPLTSAYERAGDDMFHGGPLSVYRRFDAYSSSGAIGDPAAATAEKGKQLFEAVREETAAVLAAIHEETR